MKPSTPQRTPKRGAIAGLAAPNRIRPKKPAASAKMPCDAMKPFGDALRRPAAISFFATVAVDAFGFTLNITLATCVVSGIITRSRNLGISLPATFSRP